MPFALQMIASLSACCSERSFDEVASKLTSNELDARGVLQWAGASIAEEFELCSTVFRPIQRSGPGDTDGRKFLN
jgi:hypothetical protein